jgi:GAF domain-containing protein
MASSSKAKDSARLTMGTLPAPAFDDLLFLASEICTSAIAVISLIDSDQHWFRPITGQIDQRLAGEISSLARGAVGSGELIVPDTCADPRFTTHPLVTSPPRIRFYAAIPLETLEGYAVGTLSVADRSPHVLSHEQRTGFQAVGRQVAAQVEWCRHASERERLFQDLDEALHKIQMLTGLLPICSSCKRIRDDKGYWDEVDHYIQSHSQATFTHGVCPKCLQRLYPEYFKPPSSTQ